MMNGIRFMPQNGQAQTIPLIDFEETSDNIFRVVNQFSVDYMNNRVTKCRRPDVVFFVNGLPLCVMELKNPADENATIMDAWKQITVCYW